MKKGILVMRSGLTCSTGEGDCEGKDPGHGAGFRSGTLCDTDSSSAFEEAQKGWCDWALELYASKSGVPGP
jgi:hypothetical protein